MNKMIETIQFASGQSEQKMAKLSENQEYSKKIVNLMIDGLNTIPI